MTLGTLHDLLGRLGTLAIISVLDEDVGLSVGLLPVMSLAESCEVAELNSRQALRHMP